MRPLRQLHSTTYLKTHHPYHLLLRILGKPKDKIHRKTQIQQELNQGYIIHKYIHIYIHI